MDRLPPEIISNIVGHVEDQDDQALTPLSLVCHRWQPIVEAKIYRRLRLYYASRKRPSSKPRRNPSYELLASILTPTRLSYIRQLHVTFSRRRRQSFPVSDIIIEQLFDLLTRVPHNQEPLLHVYVGFYNFFGDFFECTPPGGLPELPMVRSFQIFSFATQKALSPCALLYMASKMPRLRHLDVVILDLESIDQRVELARSLTDLPASIHSFFLHFFPDNNSEGLLVTENGEDILTRELRRFSQREGLREFLFNGYAELSIFWPPDSATSELRHWPTLESFQIQFHHPQHLASLYATESPDVAQDVNDSDTESSDDAQDANDSDRTDVHEEIMSDSFRALAKCSACMPKAEENYVYFGDIWHTRFAYCTMFPEDPCVTVTGKLDFELDEETLDEWRKTAEVHNLNFQMCVEEWTE